MYLKILKSSFLFLVAAITFSCQTPKPTEDKITTHVKDNTILYTMPGLKHGLIQSPVNILTSLVDDSQQHDIEVHYGENANREIAVVNKGHTVELSLSELTTIDFDGKSFEFMQAHFHTPSEHQVDGMTFPMEMHFVHLRKSESDSSLYDYLVIGIFFKMGSENPFIKQFIDRIPDHETDTATVLTKPISIDSLFGDDENDVVKDYFSYKGSLTTPPYTETVNWLVIKKVYEASPEQIKYINQLEGNNARHVQALYGRKIDAE